jgi:osmotically-inducible protein OsmY
MTNEELQRAVADELLFEPKLDSKEIAVSAADGIVTLRGTVGSFRQKREATNAARGVYGVTDVDNQLDVRILDDAEHDDAELRGQVLQAMMLDSMIPTTVDAKVDHGYVTLTGSANWKFERDEAEFVAGNVPGVTGLEDHIQLMLPTPPPGDIKHDIEKALERSAKVDADGLSVDTSNGTVTIDGAVSSWAEHDDVVAAAWDAAGVRDVVDNISVVY